MNYDSDILLFIIDLQQENFYCYPNWLLE